MDWEYVYDRKWVYDWEWVYEMWTGSGSMRHGGNGSMRSGMGMGI